MRRRMSSDNPFHAAIRPDSRTKAGISPTAHKCAHSNSTDAVFGDKTRGSSSPISPIGRFSGISRGFVGVGEPLSQPAASQASCGRVCGPRSPRRRRRDDRCRRCRIRRGDSTSTSPITGVWPMSAPSATISRSGLTSRMAATSARVISMERS